MQRKLVAVLIARQQMALWATAVQYTVFDTRTNIQSWISFGMTVSDVMYAAYDGSDE